MKKGFTLIELLAVIVILAIIALIATPLILNVIDDSKRGAFKSTAYGIIKAAELGYTQNVLNGIKEETIYTYVDGEQVSSEDKKLEFKGSKPESGNVIVSEEGKTAILIYNGNLCAEKNFDESDVRLTNRSKEDCQIPETFSCGKTIFDKRDGNVYSTVQIGAQCWMAENLKYTDTECLNKAWDSGEYNACRIHTSSDTSISPGPHLNWTEPQVLYQWAVAQESCPDGWHIPSEGEWNAFEDYLVDNYADRIKISNNDISWCNNTDPSICGETGFNAIPVGVRTALGDLNAKGRIANWWSSKTPAVYPFFDPVQIYTVVINAQDSYSDWFAGYMVPSIGNSIRCILNQ